MTGDDREDILNLMEANERMGVALTYIYSAYPGIKEETLRYLDQYETFEWKRNND